MRKSQSETIAERIPILGRNPACRGVATDLSIEHNSLWDLNRRRHFILRIPVRHFLTIRILGGERR
jgi:hypothetical protein